MKKKDLFISIITFSLLIFSSFACTNPVSDEEDEVHPDGFRLKMNGETVVEKLPEQQLTGGFELQVGEETDLITIYFLDHDGEEFQPESNDHSLSHEFTTEGIAEFEQHAEDGRWSFHLHAEAAGETTLQLKLMHGTHSDFTTQEIPVEVTANP